MNRLLSIVLCILSDVFAIFQMISMVSNRPNVNNVNGKPNIQLIFIYCIHSHTLKRNVERKSIGKRNNHVESPLTFRFTANRLRVKFAINHFLFFLFFLCLSFSLKKKSMTIEFLRPTTQPKRTI